MTLLATHQDFFMNISKIPGFMITVPTLLRA
jgi:hypothetical protein